MIFINHNSEHSFGFSSDLDCVFKTVVAQLVMKQPTGRYTSVRRNAGKKGNGLRHAEFAKDVFGLVLKLGTFEGALPKPKIGTGRQHE